MKSGALLIACLLAAGCTQSTGSQPPQSPIHTLSLPRSATYTIDCTQIGLGFITAVVVANSADDAFHITSVTGGNGTVATGDMLLVVAYTINGSSFSIPGYSSNGRTTYTCPFFSGRLQMSGTTTFFIAGG